MTFHYTVLPGIGLLPFVPDYTLCLSLKPFLSPSIGIPSSYLYRVMSKSLSLFRGYKLPTDPVNRRSWSVSGTGGKDLRNNSLTEHRDLQSSNQQDFIGPKTRSPRDR